MPSENPYLRGVVLPHRRAFWLRLGTLFALLLALFCALYWLLFPNDSPPMWKLGLRLAFFFAALALLLRLRHMRRKAPGAVGAASIVAEAHLLRDEYDQAVVALQSALRASYAAETQVTLLTLLGRCAERRGDFAEAAEIYGRAGGAFVVRRWAKRSQMAPGIAARRAFVLAATGRLDEASAALEQATGRDAYPGTAALAARARVLVLAKRREHAAVCALLDEARVVLKHSLPYRDRALLRIVGAASESALAGKLRGRAHADLRVDAETRAWIERAAPEVIPFLEGVA